MRETRRDTTQRPAPRQRGRAPVQRRNTRWIWLLVGGLVLALLVAAGVAAFNQVRLASGDIEGVVTYDNVPNNHQEGTVTYAQNPPVGGPHNAVWQNCGTYNAPIQNEYAVHSLEHGAVWITYRPDLPQDQIDQLKELVRGRGYVLLSPYPNLPSPIVASAWGVQLPLEQADDPRLPRFLAKYVQGPQTPEPGATCIGGNSTAVTQ